MEFFKRMFAGRNDKYAPGSIDGFMPGFRQANAVFSKEAVQLERLNRYEKNWRAFFGLSNSSPADNAERKQGQTDARVNYTQITVLRNLAFAFSKPWTLELDHPAVEDMEPGEDLPQEVVKERKTMQRMVRFFEDVVNKDNPGDTLRLEGGLYAGVTGDVVLVASPILPESLAVRYLDNGQVETSMADARIRVQAINPMFCIPEWATDGISLSKLVIRYPVSFMADTPLMKDQKETAGIFEQVITKTQIIERMYNAEQKLITEKQMDNPIGMVYAVHVRNIVSPGRYGIDDVSAIRGVVEEINDKIVDISDIIDYHTAPITLVFGARVGNLDKGANKVWSGLPEKARVENLALEGDLPAMNSYLDKLRDIIKETTGVNAAALGEDLAISNTSGVALHMRFYSMASLAELKWASWRPAIAQLSEIVLQWGAYLKQITIPEGVMRKYRRALTVKFASNLPKDELLELQKNTEATKNGMRSLRKALANLGSRDPDGDLREIEDTLTKYPKLAALVTGTTAQQVDNEPPGDTVGSTGANASGLRDTTEANP